MCVSCSFGVCARTSKGRKVWGEVGVFVCVSVPVCVCVCVSDSGGHLEVRHQTTRPTRLKFIATILLSSLHMHSQSPSLQIIHLSHVLSLSLSLSLSFPLCLFL